MASLAVLPALAGLRRSARLLKAETAVKIEQAAGAVAAPVKVEPTAAAAAAVKSEPASVKVEPALAKVKAEPVLRWLETADTGPADDGGANPKAMSPGADHNDFLALPTACADIFKTEEADEADHAWWSTASKQQQSATTAAGVVDDDAEWWSQHFDGYSTGSSLEAAARAGAAWHWQIEDALHTSAATATTRSNCLDLAADSLHRVKALAEVPRLGADDAALAHCLAMAAPLKDPATPPCSGHHNHTDRTGNGKDDDDDCDFLNLGNTSSDDDEASLLSELPYASALADAEPEPEPAQFEREPELATHPVKTEPVVQVEVDKKTGGGRGKNDDTAAVLDAAQAAAAPSTAVEAPPTSTRCAPKRRACCDKGSAAATSTATSDAFPAQKKARQKKKKCTQRKKKLRSPAPPAWVVPPTACVCGCDHSAATALTTTANNSHDDDTNNNNSTDGADSATAATPAQKKKTKKKKTLCKNNPEFKLCVWLCKYRDFKVPAAALLVNCSPQEQAKLRRYVNQSATGKKDAQLFTALGLDPERPPFLGRHFCGFTDVQAPAADDVHKCPCPEPTVPVGHTWRGSGGVYRCTAHRPCRCGCEGGLVAIIEKVLDGRVDRARGSRAR